MILILFRVRQEQRERDRENPSGKSFIFPNEVFNLTNSNIQTVCILLLDYLRKTRYVRQIFRQLYKEFTCFNIE